MKKSTLLMIVSVVLALTLSLGGTLAYLQDSDSDVNVMTLGSVYIEQIEQEWNADKTELVDFTQAKPLYPYVGDLGWTNTENPEYRRFTMSNVVDKYVSVKNTGKSEAYVRTIFAFEQDAKDMIGISTNSVNGDEFDFPGMWKWDYSVGVVEIAGYNYNVFVATHTEPLAAGETTIPSLLQVYLNKDAGNEEVENLDGNKNGTYDILVVSQAVQTAGFTSAEEALNAAFGAISVDNHPWKDGSQASTVVTVDTEEELAAAVAAGEGIVMLGADMTMPEQLEVKGDITIMGNGNKLTAPEKGTRVVNVNDSTEDVAIVLSGVKLVCKNNVVGNRGISFYNNEGALDVTILNSEVSADFYCLNVASKNEAVTLNVKDSTLTGWCAFQTYSPNTKATFDNCTLIGQNAWTNNATYPHSNCFATILVNEGATNSELTFNNCTIEANTTNSDENYPTHQAHIINEENAKVTWNNCTFKVNGAVVSTLVDIADLH